MRNLLTLILIATNAAAYGQDIESLIIFGDSFTNAGNSGTPSPPFFESRFANGPIWTDYLADHLQIGGSAKTASKDGGTNYAFGGATTGAGDSAFGAPSMKRQIDQYLGRNTPQPHDLFVMLGGANDVFVEASPQEIVSQTGKNIAQLADHGARRFLVGNMPAPANEFQALLLHPFEEHNSLLRDEIARLRRERGLDIIEFDIGALSQQIIAKPGDFGLANVTEPACRDCITMQGASLPGTDIARNPEEFYLWDLVHPTTRAHEIFAQRALETIDSHRTNSFNHQLLLDDFNDGELDGWLFSDALENAGFGTMVHDASSGELRISTENPMKHGTWDHVILAESDGDSLYAHGIVRAIVSAEAGTTSVLNIRTSLSDETDTGAEGGYLIGLEPISGTISIVNFIDEYQDGNPGFFPGIVDSEPIGFVADTRYHLEVVADGASISATAWPVGSEKPDDPQVAMNDAKSFGGGIGFSTSHGPNPPAVRNHAGAFDDLTFEQNMPGDFDNNKAIDANDIDLLTNELRQPIQRRIFDINNDGAVTLADHEFLINALGGITPGDSNLDGEFNSGDLVNVFALAKYERDVSAGWAEGDWTGDGRFDSGDLVAAFEDGAYEKGPQAVIVPEPPSCFLLTFGLISINGLKTLRHRNSRVSNW